MNTAKWTLENGQHFKACNKEVGGTAELNSEIIDQTANTHKLLTLEALHICGGIVRGSTHAMNSGAGN